MSTGKKFYGLLAVLMVISMILTACAAPTAAPAAAPTKEAAAQAPAAKEITIAYSGFATSNDFWNTLGKSAAEEAKAKGVKFIDLTTETQDAGAQKAAVDNVLTQNPSAVIIGSVDNRVWKDTIEKAKSLKIPILAVDTAIDDPYISSLIQTDNLSAAGLAGDFICKQTGGKGKVLVIGGSVGHQTGDARKKGVEDKTKACGMTVIGDWGDWSEEKDVSIAQNNLTANPDLNAIFVAHDGGAAAVSAVIKQKDLVGKVMVVGFDALPVMLKAIKAGEGTGTVKQDNVRMGKEIVDNAIKIINGGAVDKLVLIPGIMVDKTNVDQYLSGEAAAPAPAAKNPADITIAYTGFATSNDFWNTLGKSAAEEAKAKGVKFIDLTTETQDAGAQKAAVDNVITQKPSAIIIGSVDNRVWKDSIEKAKAAGIPILAVDTAIDDPYISSLIQTDNLSAAGLAGDFICKQTGGKGTVLVIGGSVGHQTGDARKKGVEDKTKACGMTVIGDWGDWSEEKDVSIAQNTLAANPDLNAIFVAHDGGAAAVSAVIKQKGLTGKVLVVGFDALPVMLKAIKAGEGTGTVKQDNVRMGKEIVDNAIAIINGQPIDKLILIPGIMVDKTNVDQYLGGEAAAPAAKNPADITIAYTGFATSNDFWNTLGKSAAEEAKAKGVKFIDLTTETQDAGAQKAAVDNVITQKPSAIIIGSVDNRVWKDSIEKAKAAGIPILAVDTAIDDPYISSLIQTDNLSAAGLAGDFICQQTGGKGTVLVIGGSVGHQTGDARKKGVEDKTKACGMTVIGDWGDWSEEKDVSIAQNTLAANPDLNAIFVAHDGGAAAVSAVIKQKGLTGKVLVVGFDALPVMLKAIKAGEGTGTVKQDNVRMGKEIVDNAIAIINGQPIEKLILIPGIMVDKTNVDQYLQ
jgi:ABC-type sugar transport system substrate-binding protein